MSPQQPANHPSERIHVRYVAGDVNRTLQSSDSLLIGRDDTCDLRLDSLAVARHHAEIYRVGGLWWVRDLGSSDGTYLDEECIEAAPVVVFSSLQLGAGGPRIWLEPRG